MEMKQQHSLGTFWEQLLDAASYKRKPRQEIKSEKSFDILYFPWKCM